MYLILDNSINSSLEIVSFESDLGDIIDSQLKTVGLLIILRMRTSFNIASNNRIVEAIRRNKRFRHKEVCNAL